MSAFIDHKKPGVVHYVRDLKLAAEWYRDMLGFDIGPQDYVSFVEMYMNDQYIFHLSPASEANVPHPQPVICRDLDGNAVAVTQHFEMRTRELEEIRLVGIRVVCADESGYFDAIPKAARELRQRLHEISDVIDPHQMVGAH